MTQQVENTMTEVQSNVKREIGDTGYEEVTKKLKLQGTDDIWLPPSITSLDRLFKFDSTTYHSSIPSEVAKNKDEAVVLGVDEAGRGPVLGPMVYGISYALESYHDHLKSKYGFADSKTLKDDRRQALFKLIEDEADELHQNVGWATATMTAKDISSGMLQNVHGKGSYNLNEQAHDATAQLIRQVIDKGVNLKSIYVDTVGPPVSYQAKLSKLFPGIDITVCKKADSIYPIVSTASVVAKVTRDLNLIYYSRNLPSLDGQKLGSGYPSDPNTSKWLTSNVDDIFGWCFGLIRFSWQTAKDCLEKNNAAKVIYEDDCIKDSSYKDISSCFDTVRTKQPEISKLYYGSDEVSI